MACRLYLTVDSGKLGQKYDCTGGLQSWIWTYIHIHKTEVCEGSVCKSGVCTSDTELLERDQVGSEMEPGGSNDRKLFALPSRVGILQNTFALRRGRTTCRTKQTEVYSRRASRTALNIAMLIMRRYVQNQCQLSFWLRCHWLLIKRENK